MEIEKNKAYAEVLRQLSTVELLDRYYKDPQIVDRILKGKTTEAEIAAEPLTINGVHMSEKDARDYLIMQLVKRGMPEQR